MDSKLNTQQLANLLSRRRGISEKEAERFVREYFALIDESLERDKYVKIKGFGTFKLIVVESRESINVNTGQRFEIQSHTKVSFTPDANLKEIINRPFSHFETVILNAETTFDEKAEAALEAEPPTDTEDIEPDVPAESSESIPLAPSNPLKESTEPEVEVEIEVPTLQVAEQVTEVTEQAVVETATEQVEEAAEPVEGGVAEQPAVVAEKVETVARQVEETEAVQEDELVEQRDEATEDVDEGTEVEEEVHTTETQQEVPRRKGSSRANLLVAAAWVIVVLCVGVNLYLYFPQLFERISDKIVEIFQPPPAEERAREDNTQLPSSSASSLPTAEDEDADEVAQEPSVEPKVASGPAGHSVTSATSSSTGDNQQTTTQQSAATVVLPTQPAAQQPAATLGNQSAQATQQTAQGTTSSLSEKIPSPTNVKLVEEPGGYVITGMQTTHTIQEGETLTKVAMQYYGTKLLWPYIVNYNTDLITDPNVVPPGITLRIPKLEKK